MLGFICILLIRLGVLVPETLLYELSIPFITASCLIGLAWLGWALSLLGDLHG